jgi:hypothetical protein
MAPGFDPAEAAEFLAHQKRIADLEHRLATLAEEVQRSRDEQAAWESKRAWTRAVTVSGYVQPQLLWQWFDANGSPNLVGGQLPPGVGANSVIATAEAGGPALTTNGDYFRLRSVRPKVELAPNRYTRLVVEIDPIPAGGPDNATGTIARNVESQGIVPWCACAGGLETTFGMGIFRVPFGREVLESDADRPFIEHSWWEDNVFPGEFDTGARAYTTALDRALDVQLAVVNGSTQGEKTFALLPDMNHGKDAVGRVHATFGAMEVGASGYFGQGQEASLAPVPTFKQFFRYAINAEAALRLRLLGLGETRASAEIDRGQNMDRGVRYAPAIALPGLPADIVHGSVVAKDELGAYVRVEQDLTPLFTVAVRYDTYSPDTAQAHDGRDTLAAVGVAHFTRQLQLMIELDHFVDDVHLPGAQPADRHGAALSTVLQARYP